ncbi:YbaN family protein [Alteromonas alba]|nr:YbaN family protein [Alteromonas alba]
MSEPRCCSPSRSSVMRPVWLLLGVSCVVLGGIGAVLPLLPTVPFMLLAAYCFARSSNRAHDWLINHRIFGPAIADWQRSGAISLAAKYAATASVVVVYTISIVMDLRPALLIVQGITLCAVMAFIWSRPHH